MPKNNSKEIRTLRRDQAEWRQEIRANRSDTEQIVVLAERPGSSNKEISRLVQRIVPSI